MWQGAGGEAGLRLRALLPDAVWDTLEALVLEPAQLAAALEAAGGEASTQAAAAAPEADAPTAGEAAAACTHSVYACCLLFYPVSALLGAGMTEACAHVFEVGDGRV
jgi:hypothetical protein